MILLLISTFLINFNIYVVFAQSNHKKLNLCFAVDAGKSFNLSNETCILLFFRAYFVWWQKKPSRQQTNAVLFHTRNNSNETRNQKYTFVFLSFCVKELLFFYGRALSLSVWPFSLFFFLLKVGNTFIEFFARS